MTPRDLIQRKISDHILQVRDTIVFISLRVGKTRIALMSVEPMERILVVYPDKAIKDSWLAELEKYEPASRDITFVTKASLHKFANTEWDYLIVDEPQLIQSEKQINTLKTIKYRKRVGLTGTLNQKTIKTLAEQLKWKVGITYTIGDAIRDKLVKDYRIFIHFCELDNTQKFEYEKFKRTFYGTEKEINQYYTDQMAYFTGKEAEAEDPRNRLFAQMGYKKFMGLRTNFLYNSVALLRKAKELAFRFVNHKVLIYTLRTEIADELSDKVYHSKNREEDVLIHFKKSQTGHMAVVNSVRAGVTIENLSKVLFHSYESNTEILYQKLGRSLLYEFAGDVAEIHICCLQGTQMEVWVDRACQALEQEKIFYIHNGRTYSKIEWLQISFPDKEIYFYNGSVVYRVADQEGMFGMQKHYEFLESPGKPYPLSESKLIRI